GSGEEIVAIESDRQMIPASNMKVLTSGAALHALGPNFRFNTKLMLDGDRLVVIGDGDPAFGDPDLLKLMSVDGSDGLDVDGFLNLWIQAMEDTGIESISEVIVDDRIFDRRFVHETWPIEQLNSRSFAEVAGLTFHLNVLRFYPKPVPGQRPDITDFHPKTHWLIPANSATCREGAHEENSGWIARKHNTNELTFYGNIKTSKRPVMVPVTIHNVPEFFAQLLAERLRRAGLTVGGYRVVEPTEGEFAGRLLEPVITTPLSTAITRCNRDSKNIYAECLIKRIGHARTGQPGSWTNGTAIVRLVIHERLANRILSSNVVIADASGLSRENRIAPGTMTGWLNSFHTDETLGPVFIDSLAHAGVSGTLAKRFKDIDLHGASVQAKTGFINGVSCLSGYVTMPDGRRRCFSVMVNDIPAHRYVYTAKRLQEKIVAAIVDDMAVTEVQALGGE
ncbi:MAG: D-alanyl-D-alanine carboxypeptidase/D-alanyl-D-alanine-endopeptidase, partial [Phycisphaerales bacterium]